ncbi:hypothetical protein V1525DRAFT_123478 [Lipomyces kononenkoae]|uniref:Uncharacterized protein n=1 Tax=Lipomyces kononenkoae TaxID=34357 RepID=A0ACC3SQ59_LIPKO
MYSSNPVDQRIEFLSQVKVTIFVHTSGEPIVSGYPPPFQFTAISYHWARVSAPWRMQTPRHTATVGAFYHDHFMKLLKWVEENLGKEGIHHVWIDAICIDQSNEAEKAEQLGEITYLFHDAKCVVLAPWLAHRHGIGPVQLYHNYAQRCWVIAEIASARCIYYTYLNGSYVNSSRNNPAAEGFCPPGADPGQMTPTETMQHRRMSDRVVILRRNRNFGEFHVDEIVKIALALEATKEQDKLYALMPIAGKRVPRLRRQFDLQSCIRYFMQNLEPIDRLRLAIGVSRFRNHASVRSHAWRSHAWPSGSSPSWSFGEGSDYLEPWAVDEYMEYNLDASLRLSEDNYSLVFHGRWHKCSVFRGQRTPNSQYYYGLYTIQPDTIQPSVNKYLYYYPQLDKCRHEVILCGFGLDHRRRLVGIILEQGLNEKIGTFMMGPSEGLTHSLEHWKIGSVVIL